MIKYSQMPQEPELQTHHQLKSGSPIPVPDDIYHSHLNMDHTQEQSNWETPFNPLTWPASKFS